MRNSAKRHGWLATFVAGGLATASSRAGWGVKPPEALGPKAGDPLDGAGGGVNVAILVGLLLMPCVIGAGLATDPSVRIAGVRALAASAPAMFRVVCQGEARPLQGVGEALRTAHLCV